MPDRSSPAVAWRLFVVCWVLYAMHFATNTVREIYPALSLGDHLSFDVSEYLGFHPDIFEVPGRGAFINNNPGASIVGAVPYTLMRPIIDRIIAWQQTRRQGANPPARTYDSIYPMAREFYEKAQERGFDIKFGLGAAVMQSLAMAPLSALSVVVMYYLFAALPRAANAAVPLALLYGVATPIFFRTGQLNQNLLVAHCALFAFALLWRPWAPGSSARPFYFCAGLLSGWAVVCDYSGLVVVIALGVYAFLRWRSSPPARTSDLVRFIAGVLLSGSALFAYQWSSFGNPFFPAQHYMPPAHFTERGYVGFDWPSLDLLWQTLFGLRFGLITSAPIFLLALYPPAWTRALRIVGPHETCTIALFCVLFSLFCSANQYGRMQFNTGVRHVIPVCPFAFLIVAGVLLRLRPLVACMVAAVAAYWSWCLAMYRDVEQGLGVLEPVLHVTREGLRLPWLKTLEAMGYLNHPTPLPIFALFAAMVWVTWTTCPRWSDRGTI